MPKDEIEILKNCFVKALNPLRIYLFGSFADGSATNSSDFDFYIIMDDSTEDLWKAIDDAYASIEQLDRRPVDIVIGTEKKFNKRKMTLFNVENEVMKKGVVIYDSRN